MKLAVKLISASPEMLSLPAEELNHGLGEREPQERCRLGRVEIRRVEIRRVEIRRVENLFCQPAVVVLSEG
jgi:hypothetical protein